MTGRGDASGEPRPVGAPDGRDPTGYVATVRGAWILLLVVATGCGSPAGPDTPATDALNHPLELVDGGATTLTALHADDGRPIIVNLWATWCAPCLDEMPDLEAAHRRHGDRVRFVGINISDSPTRSAERVAELGITYLLARDPDGDLTTALGGVGLPITAFVDAGGRLTDVHQGRLSPEDLESAIAELAP